jgi:hypothetical protein
MISFVDSSDNLFALGQYIWHPPYESRFDLNPLCDSKLSHLYGIRLFQVCKSIPGSHAIFPFCAELPSLCGLSIVLIVVVRIDIHVIMCNSSTIILSPIDDFIE